MTSKDKKKLTTVQITKETSEMLGLLSASYKRSKASHVEWLIQKDYEYWRSKKLIPAVETVEENEGKVA